MDTRWCIHVRWWIYAHKQPFKKTKSQNRSYLWVIFARWDDDWPFLKPHTALSCMHVCFTLEKSQWEFITAFFTAGMGVKGLWVYNRALARPWPFLSFSCIMLVTQYSRARKSWLSRWKYLGEKCLAFPAEGVSRCSQTQAGPYLSSSFSQADHRLRRYKGEKNSTPSSGPSHSWEVIRISSSSQSGPYSSSYLLSIMHKNSSAKLPHEKIIILTPL